MLYRSQLPYISIVVIYMTIYVSLAIPFHSLPIMLALHDTQCFGMSTYVAPYKKYNYFLL